MCNTHYGVTMNAYRYIYLWPSLFIKSFLSRFLKFSESSLAWAIKSASSIGVAHCIYTHTHTYTQLIVNNLHVLYDVLSIIIFIRFQYLLYNAS